MMQKKTILIVDDDPLNTKLLSAQLGFSEFETIAAHNGKRALEIVQAKAPDLILLDIMMPGMNGYEVTERLKRNPSTRDIPIILITALEDTENKLKGLEAGADEFLNKPANVAELLARVKSLLRIKEYQDQLKSRHRSHEWVVAKRNEDTSHHQGINLPRILLVEDEDKDARLIQSCLHGEAYHVEVDTTGEAAISRVLKENIDLVLLDILLPGMNGFEVVRQLRNMEEAKNIQIVAVTNLRDTESKIKGIELGADDYLTKPICKGELRVRIRSLVKKKAYLDTLCRGYRSAVHLAITDKLTGLYNRAYFEHFLELEIKRSGRQRLSFALVMLDVDDFKQYNDTYGHLVGDRILQALGRLVRENIRDFDMAARFGGEEFVFLLPNTDNEAAVMVAERLRQTIFDHSFFSEGDQEKQLSVSMGVSAYPAEALSVEELIRIADMKLYRAKREGKNLVCSRPFQAQD